MKTDEHPNDFEVQLRRQPLRSMPGAWRAQILSAAAGERPKTLATKDQPPPLPWWSSWRDLLWPNPRAWAGLAAAWVIIAVLNVAGSFSPLTAAAATHVSAEPTVAWAQRQRELLELLETFPAQALSQRQAPAPRSGIRSPNPAAEFRLRDQVYVRA